MPLQRGIRIRPNISSNSNEFNVVLPVLSKKYYRHTTSVTGLLDELGWLPLFERRKHSRLTVFYKALITFQPFLWITFQFHHGILEPPMKTNLRHCQFVLMLSNIHFFLGPLPIGITSHWLFASRSRFSHSMGVC